MTKLTEILREAERVIDHQVRAQETLDGKVVAMTNLAVASLAGAFALGAFMVERVYGRGLWFLVLLAVGGVLNAGAISIFVRAHGALWEDVELIVGPEPLWLSEKAAQQDWSLDAHRASVIKGHAAYFAANDAAMVFVARQRRIGVRFLASAVAVYALVLLGFLYLFAATNQA